MSVLDVVHGVGDVSAIAAELVGAGGHVLGFDHDERQVSAATRAFRRQYKYLVRAGDARRSA